MRCRFVRIDGTQWTHLLSAVWNDIHRGDDHGSNTKRSSGLHSSEGTKRAGNFDHSRIQGYQAFLPTYRPRLMRRRVYGRLIDHCFRLYFCDSIFCAFADTDNARSDHVVGAGKIPVPWTIKEIARCSACEGADGRQPQRLPDGRRQGTDYRRRFLPELKEYNGFRNGCHLVLSVSLCAVRFRVELHKDFVVSSTPGLQASTNPRRIA